MKRIGILQPSYLPWLGCFDQIWSVDEFVFLDDIQFDKHGWRNRNRIKTAAGVKWLTVPVRHTGRFGQSLAETEIADQKWVRKQMLTLEQAYAKAPYVNTYLPQLANVLTSGITMLNDLNIALTRLIASWLDIDTTFRLSSQLGVPGNTTTDVEKNARLIAMCEFLGADHYLSGAAGASYLANDEFKAHGITVEFQAFEHPVYPQLHGDFVSHLSVIDLFFNCGPNSRKILQSGQVKVRQRAYDPV